MQFQTADEALKYLATLVIEYAEDFGRARKPATQTAVMTGAEAACAMLRDALADKAKPEAPHRGDHQG